MDDDQPTIRTMWVVSDEGGAPFQVELGEGEKLPNFLHPIVEIGDLHGLRLDPYALGRGELPKSVIGLEKELG
ncbi:hypothetical protein HY409_01645 [Candidatus Gottesmanbacteria bacterium]|nr:hypothetical protein [Candidatus Gottesmanbacteria bacterium]